MTLDKTALYWTPRGHMCRWVPLNGEPGQHRSWGWLLFHYVSVDDGKQLADGFTLTPENVRILRRVF